jgi:rRNA maturation endonuclease Nob1
MKIYENKVFFKICEDCKKKIDKEVKKCADCGCP